jgi:hypothetical protein
MRALESRDVGATQCAVFRQQRELAAAKASASVGKSSICLRPKKYAHATREMGVFQNVCVQTLMVDMTCDTSMHARLVRWVFIGMCVSDAHG